SGAFDVTVAPLVNAWGFGFKNEKLPSDEKIDSLLQYVGMDKVQLGGERLVKLVEGVQMDASSIAKGLGVDLVAEFFDRKGVQNYMIEIGV
ncbi:MAG: FAD:protein FMN transferase, partial [Butyricimonas faecihominis]